MDWVLLAISCTSIATNSLGVAANVLLIYLVLEKTPKELATYSILLFNFGISDLLACSSALFVQPRIVAANHDLYLFYYGPCGFFGPMVCLIGYGTMMHSCGCTLWILVFSFVYRYYVLHNAIPRWRTVVVLLILLYLPSLLVFVIFCASSSNADYVKSAIQKDTGYNITSECVSHLNVYEWKTLIPVLYIVLPVVPFYCIIITLRKLTMFKLRATRTLSEHSRLVHAQLLKALTAQAIIPLFYVIGGTLYGIGQLDIIHHPYLEYSPSILLGFLVMFNPLTSLYFIRPYRTWITRCISKAYACVN